MIIVRENKYEKRSIYNDAFSVYLVADDGTEHKIPGVISVKRNHELPGSPYHIFTADIVINDTAIRFE